MGLINNMIFLFGEFSIRRPRIYLLFGEKLSNKNERRFFMGYPTGKSEVLHGLPDTGSILAGERPPREKEIRRKEKSFGFPSK